LQQSVEGRALWVSDFGTTHSHPPDETPATIRTHPGSAAPESVGSHPSRNLALVAMLFAVAMTFIDQTIVAIAAPSIQSQLSLSRGGTRSVVNSYLLALAAAFALGGRLADVLGHRRTVIIGIVGFAGSFGVVRCHARRARSLSRGSFSSASSKVSPARS
jgi:hypothetical protein